VDLEFDTLKWAKVPHLERLAFNKRRHAAEERRMAEVVKVAERIAESLGEIGERPRAQIRRIVGLMGAQWAADACEAAACLVAGMESDTLGLLRLPDGTARSFGGVFFAWCRRTASEAVKAGRITRRQFFRAFTDRPRAPKVAKTAPVRPGGKKARKDVTRNWGAPRTHDKRSKAPVPVEVYVTRRRA
jgi:hypothetical protein